jgi:O-antigen ligase
MVFRPVGADWLKSPAGLGVSAIVAILLGFIIARAQVAAIALMIGLPFIVLFLARLFNSPRIGIFTLIVWAFLGLGSARYVQSSLGGGAMGLGIDFLLLLTFLALFFKEFRALDWKSVRSPLMIWTLAWFGYNIFELFLPGAPPLEAWFYASRGITLYTLVTIPLALFLFRKREDVDSFFKLWFAMSLVGSLWGIKQHIIGLDSAEKLWLSEPGNFSTHLLFGKLRIFSFYTDAGQFGAAQGHAAVSAFVLALGPGSRTRKTILALIGIVSFYCMVISGTRGALGVPVAGFAAYLLLSKNWKILIVGFLALGTFYGLLKFTYIGQDNPEIRRLRTAVDPNDASFQARLINQRKLADYLNTHPFGGGVGSAGFWGQRFNPNSFLAQLALDSWYVRVAAEYGIVGLVFYLLMILAFLFTGFRNVNRLRDPETRQKIAALYAGVVGIAVASYGNQVWGQMPTGIIINLSLVFLYVAPEFDPR